MSSTLCTRTVVRALKLGNKLRSCGDSIRRSYYKFVPLSSHCKSAITLCEAISLISECSAVRVSYHVNILDGYSVNQ